MPHRPPLPFAKTKMAIATSDTTAFCQNWNGYCHCYCGHLSRFAQKEMAFVTASTLAFCSKRDGHYWIGHHCLFTKNKWPLSHRTLLPIAQKEIAIVTRTLLPFAQKEMSIIESLTTAFLPKRNGHCYIGLYCLLLKKEMAIIEAVITTFCQNWNGHYNIGRHLILTKRDGHYYSGHYCLLAKFKWLLLLRTTICGANKHLSTVRKSDIAFDKL